MKIDFLIESGESVVVFLLFFIFILGLKFFSNVDLSACYGIYIQLCSTISFINTDIDEIFFLLNFIFNLFFIIISSLEDSSDKKILGIEASWIFLFLSFFLNELVYFDNLIMLYICVEASTFCLFLLLTLKYDQISVEGAVKYLLLSAASSVWLCFSFLLIYSWAETLDISEIFLRYNEKNLKIIPVSIIIFYVALTTKLGLFPGYLVAGDVSESLTASTFLILNIVYKIVALYLIVYFQKNFNSIAIDLFWMLICTISIVQGGIATFLQKNIMRFLAFGSVPQFGFLTLAIQGDIVSQRLAVLYLLVYLNALLKILLFLESIKNFETLVNLMDLSILNKNNDLKYYLLNIILELGGLPPSNLFFIKFFIVGMYFQFFIFQVIVFLIVTILMCFYYLRLIKILFYEMEDNLYFTALPESKVNDIFGETFTDLIVLIVLAAENISVV